MSSRRTARTSSRRPRPALAADVDAAVRAARAAFDDGPWPRHEPRRADRGGGETSPAVYSSHVDEMADLITAQMGSPASFSRLGQAAGAASMMHLRRSRRGRSRGPNAATACSARCICAELPVGVVGIIIPVERAAEPVDAQADSGTHRRMHGRDQAGARDPVGLAVGGRDDRADRPSRRRGLRRPRRPRGGRGAGAPSRRRQDRLHRELRHRSPHRGPVRRAAQALQPGTGRQVRRDRPRRRRHRQDGGRAEDGQPDEQRPGLRGADPHPGQRAQTRRVRRRAGRHDVGS